MTDLLIIIIAVVFILVLLDGLRRKWSERRHRVVMKLDKRIPPADDRDEEELMRSELPNGGARTVARGERSAPATSGRSKKRSVPMLLDAVELEDGQIEHAGSRDAGAERASAVQSNSGIAGGVGGGVGSKAGGMAANTAGTKITGEKSAEESGMGVYIEPYDGELEDDVSPARTRLRNKGQHDDWDDDEEWEEDDDYEDDEDDEEDDEGDWDDDEEDDEDEDDDEYWEDDDDDADEELDEELEGDYDEEDEEDDEEDDEDDWDDDDEDDEDEDDFPDYDDDDAYSSLSAARPEQRKEPVLPDEELDTYEFTDDFSAATDEADPPRHLERTRTGRKEAEHRSVFGSGFLSKKMQGELFREEAAHGHGPEAGLEGADEEEDAGPQEVIIINVMAKPGRVFEGYELLPVLQLQGMRLGDMSIFHKHSGSSGSGSVLFSMANMVKPGTFDLASMQNFTTPGVSFFLQLPNRHGNMASFEQMLNAANSLRTSLDGELKDENRSVFTRQTMEHYKQRIRDFELRMLAHK